MTEAEYVQAIGNAAQRYLDVVRDPATHHGDGQQRIRHWEAIRDKISPFTLITLCDVWLAVQEGQSAAVAGEEASARARTAAEAVAPVSGENSGI